MRVGWAGVGMACVSLLAACGGGGEPGPEAVDPATSTTLAAQAACRAALDAGETVEEGFSGLASALRKAIDTRSDDFTGDVGNTEAVAAKRQACTGGSSPSSCRAYYDALTDASKVASRLLEIGDAAHAEAVSMTGEPGVVAIRKRELASVDTLLRERVAVMRSNARACRRGQVAQATPTTHALPPITVAERFWQKLVAEKLGGPDSGSLFEDPVDEDSAVSVGYSICGSLEEELSGGWSRSETLRNNEVGQGTPTGRRTAIAVEIICPTAVNLSALADATSDNPQQHSPPAESFTDGGRVGYGGKLEIHPGKYRSDGGPACYWAIYSGAVNAELIDNHFGPGPVEVDLHEGQHVQSDRCGEWRLVK